MENKNDIAENWVSWFPQKRRDKTWGKYIESIWSSAVLDILDICQDLDINSTISETG